MTYTKLFPLLLEHKLIEVVPLKLLEPPYPRSYDPNARCDYHGGAVGHGMEKCWDDGLLGFENKGPNVHSNPLLTHVATTVNTISHVEERVASPNRSKNEEYGQAMGSVNQVEEGPHPYQSDDFAIVACIEGNNNPHPKSPVYNNNLVPWKYPIEEPQAPQIRKETTTPKVTNIAEVGGMT
ncbi:hypothetical protein CR513_35743, partial [Mucuna pruriens]